MNSYNDYKCGDVLILMKRMRTGTEQRSAIVTCINFNGNKLVTFTGHRVDGCLEAGTGAFNPETVGQKPFGLVAVCRIDHVTIANHHWQPCPGDRGYDLMC